MKCADSATYLNFVQSPVGDFASFSPNPPKGLALALTQGLMGRGRRTGQARFQ